MEAAVMVFVITVVFAVAGGLTFYNARHGRTAFVVVSAILILAVTAIFYMLLLRAPGLDAIIWAAALVMVSAPAAVGWAIGWAGGCYARPATTRDS